MKNQNDKQRQNASNATDVRFKDVVKPPQKTGPAPATAAPTAAPVEEPPATAPPPDTGAPSDLGPYKNAHPFVFINIYIPPASEAEPDPLEVNGKQLVLVGDSFAQLIETVRAFCEGRTALFAYRSLHVDGSVSGMICIGSSFGAKAHVDVTDYGITVVSYNATGQEEGERVQTFMERWELSHRDRPAS